MPKNPCLAVAIGAFNAKSKFWYCNDITISHGNVLENITSQFALQQVIKETSHILDNCLSCIDLIFSSQPNLISELGVYTPFHSNCHHQIAYAKFNLQFYYLSQYYQQV